MGTPTYTAIASQTLTSSASSVTFSSIPQDYRDLILVVNAVKDGAGFSIITFNADSSSIYSRVNMVGDGTSATSGSATGAYIRESSTLTLEHHDIFTIFDYSVTDKHKSILWRHNDAGVTVEAIACRYGSTSAITEITWSPYGDNFNAGSTFSLYGVAA